MDDASITRFVLRTTSVSIKFRFMLMTFFNCSGDAVV